MLYEALKPVAWIALRWYYRSISVAGRRRIPATGPVLLAVNHPNALVDALVVACVTPRRVGFTAKSTLFTNPLLARFLQTVGVVPLRRTADMAKPAAISAPRTDSENATAPGALPPNPANADAPSALPLDPARNAESFRAVAAALGMGRAIVVFPEGKSHDEPRLAPLRTGLARMALLARDSFGVRGIKIVPVGLLFERKEEPRSRVLVQTGEPIDVDSMAPGNNAVEALTQLVAERLAAVTVNFENAGDLARIAGISETMAALIEPHISIGDDGPSLNSVLAIARRAERVRARLEANAPPELVLGVLEFERRLQQFRERLARESVTPSNLFIDVGAAPGVRFALREGIVAALLTPVALWGRITHFVPLRVARWLALRGARNRDEPAMNTIVIGFVLVLLSYAAQTALVWMLSGAGWALLFLITLIPSASSDLQYGDRVRRRTERMRAYLAFRKRPGLQSELLAEADWLRRQAGAIEQQL